MEARTNGRTLFERLKAKNCQPRALFAVKYVGKMNTFSFEGKVRWKLLTQDRNDTIRNMEQQE